MTNSTYDKFIVYTPRNGKKRIISARAALSRERKLYYERIRCIAVDK